MREMNIKSEKDITRLIESDGWMMNVLWAAKTLNLDDWWIGAGFLRDKVWDSVSNIAHRPTRDVDLVYFNLKNTRPEADWQYDEYMKKEYPFAEWEVRNQARMHYVNGFEPYASTAEGISNWIETATCVGVRLKDKRLEYLFCYGIQDLIGLVARPVPRFQTTGLMPIFYERIKKKQWRRKWPNLIVLEK
ncbi:MAG: nucleotidyltransferase family protein [Candidatus Microsaccharimonas sossegonensis]|uniref:Nucleotidyltransferase family protein n=1 Tax=Candidatus Microsaccharimonas sossegonensis TaxID=2506948 RepID=A0A4Q0AGJ2_9BACT|nr:MAG: nucleotidyltransferase family protein [Candidatus Microsaccharimonas sossegonensis]